MSKTVWTKPWRSTMARALSPVGVPGVSSRMIAMLARSSRSSRSERIVGPWAGRGRALGGAFGVLGAKGDDGRHTRRRSSGSRAATLSAPFWSPRARRKRASSSSAWARRTEWSPLRAVRAAGSEARASSRLPPAAHIRARSSWAR